MVFVLYHVYFTWQIVTLTLTNLITDAQFIVSLYWKQDWFCLSFIVYDSIITMIWIFAVVCISLYIMVFEILTIYSIMSGRNVCKYLSNNIVIIYINNLMNQILLQLTHLNYWLLVVFIVWIVDFDLNLCFLYIIAS